MPQSKRRSTGTPYRWLFVCVPTAFFLWRLYDYSSGSTEEIGLQPLQRSASTGESAVPSALRSHAASDDDTVHVVFSTDCSGYQQWQSIAFWYAAQEAGHPGPITRIASGCTEADKQRIVSEMRKMDSTGRFRIHFTELTELPPAGTQRTSFKYSNKPGGMLQWIQHADPPIAENYVALVDPDMLLLRPITVQLAEGLSPRSRDGRAGPTQLQQELVDPATGIARVLATKSNVAEMASRIAKGRPAGQHFGIGGIWTRAGTSDVRSGFQNFSKEAVCGAAGKCMSTKPAVADSKYAVGFVYIAHVSDWLNIATTWWSFTPPVHRQYANILAEMMAFSMAAAELELPFSLLSSYMVSDPKTGHPSEAWAWVEDLARGPDGPAALCAGATATTLPLATRARPAPPLPTTLHLCHQYKAGGHHFWKRTMPHGFFKCDGAPLPFDVSTLMRELSSEIEKSTLRSAFMLCHVIPILNRALASYKRDVCGIVDGGVGTF